MITIQIIISLLFYSFITLSNETQTSTLIGNVIAPDSVEKVIVAPLREVTGPIRQMVAESRLSDWIPVPLRRYTPNPYGYGGLDPAGGERKGGNGRGIPDAVAVGWWKGEEVMYPERKLSSVEDTREEPAKPMVADVGWWGDDWLA